MIESTPTKARIGVLVLGSVNRDEFLYVDTLPAAGETTLAHATSSSLGGKGANQSAAAAKLGASVLFLGQVGNDDAGNFVRQEFRRLGIPTRLVAPQPTTSTGRAAIIVDAHGENSIVVAAGANAALSATDVQTLVAEQTITSSLTPRTICLAQGETPIEATETFARFATESGLRFVLNLAPVVGLSAGAIATADPLVLNQSEAALLSESLAGDHGSASTSKAMGLANVIANGHAKSVVITLGGNGAVASDGDETWHQPAPDPGRVVDTTGAGDCFVGALAAALSAGESLRDAVAVGVAAGSFAVRSNGTTESYPSKRQLDSAFSRSQQRKSLPS
jgi:ribokinase